MHRNIYTLRNMVERSFNKLKNARRLVTRYAKSAVIFSGFMDTACIGFAVAKSLGMIGVRAGPEEVIRYTRAAKVR